MSCLSVSDLGASPSLAHVVAHGVASLYTVIFGGHPAMFFPIVPSVNPVGQHASSPESCFPLFILSVIIRK